MLSFVESTQLLDQIPRTMAKPQVGKSEPQKAPYVKPRILIFKVNPSFASTQIELPTDLVTDQEVRIGWKEYLGVSIGSILGYALFRIVHVG